MKELAFLLSLKNNLSAPLGKAQQSVEAFAKKSASAFKQVAIGAAGLWGVVQGVKGLLGPADQVQAALDELSTRNVSTDSLDKMYQSAQRFSTAYGKSAAEFIASGTIIKSELAGLADTELPRAAVAINTLAVATKSSAAQAASYMSDMANNYRSTVRQIGNVPFVEMMASKAAYMAQNFGASIDEIRELVKSSKGTGTQYGAGMDEQLAVMGLLSQTKGTEAGGIYDAFLKGAIEGGKQLGLSFTDAQGKMLQFPDILQKVQAKFGDTIEGNVKAQAALNKAFGDGAQALTAAWGQADALRKHMRDMGNTQGLDRATEMAAKMAKMWERVDKVWERIRVAVGMRLIPAITPLVDYAIKAGETFAKWLDMFPNIARWIGYIALGTLALGAAGAAANIVVGVSKFIWLGLTGIWKLATVTAKALLWVINLKARALQLASIAAIAYNGVMRFVRATLLACALAFRTSTAAALLQRAGMMISTVAMWAFGGATAFAGVAMQLLMSPITLIIAAVALLVAGVWYAIKHWDELKAALMDTEAFRWVADAAEVVGRVFSVLWQVIRVGWKMVVEYFSGLSPVEAFTGFVDTIRNVFSGLWNYLLESFGKTYNWIITKLNKIPGVNIDLKPVGDAAPNVSGVAAPAGLNAPQMERGGIGKAISNGNGNKVTDNSRQIGQVNIYPQNQQTFDSLMESRELAAG
ncbi:phage tail tape measure protein [Serratia fonticola]|jgi:TP901 family phage tail tape measure protein|uniref:phage tail tape measure protein n=1 Tax=Serratia fonticola TaxID=47917 RepID=UPI001AE14D88|nr:phage tail tape measure protein [Serratia fonticola]MBP1037841.1 phage tail tape measure protein [Serratia fonticola]